MPRFGTQSSRYNVSFKDIEVTDLPTVFRTLTTLFTSILDDVTEFAQEEHLLQLSLQTRSLEFPVTLPFMQVKDLSSEFILKEIERILQSNEHFTLDDT